MIPLSGKTERQFYCFYFGPSVVIRMDWQERSKLKQRRINILNIIISYQNRCNVLCSRHCINVDTKHCSEDFLLVETVKREINENMLSSIDICPIL